MVTNCLSTITLTGVKRAMRSVSNSHIFNDKISNTNDRIKEEMFH